MFSGVVDSVAVVVIGRFSLQIDDVDFGLEETVQALGTVAMLGTSSGDHLSATLVELVELGVAEAPADEDRRCTIDEHLVLLVLGEEGDDHADGVPLLVSDVLLERSGCSR